MLPKRSDKSDGAEEQRGRSQCRAEAPQGMHLVWMRIRLRMVQSKQSILGIKGHGHVLLSCMLLLCALATGKSPSSLKCNEHMAAYLLVSKSRLLLGHERSHRDAPALLDAWLLLGEAHELKEEGQEAMLAYSEAISAATPAREHSDAAVARARLRRGMLLEMSSLHEAAFTEYVQGVWRVAAHDDLWYHIGYLYLLKSEHALAIRSFRTCCRLNASHALGQEGLGTAFFGSGDVLGAVHRFRRALALMGGQHKSSTLLNLAAALGKQATDRDTNFLAQAIAAYQQVLLEAPGNGDALGKLLQLNAEICDWRELDAHVTRLAHLADLQVEALRPLYEVGEEEAARVIWGDQIDVLIDLMGHTRGNRRGILCWCPSPVQVSYKGYMSTSGAPRDTLYLLGDALSTPPEFAQGYSEALVFLPISSFISGHAENHREVLEETPYAANTKRSAAVEAVLGSLGIRRNESLLCSFNGLYKLDPHAWHTWMDILRNLSFSSEPTCSERTCSTSNWRLWLSREPPQAYAALCRESEARGVACDRLLFTHHVPFHLHIQVKGRCAIAVDTPKYNSHGTAADILWAGVPFVSAPRLTMAARLATSILTSAQEQRLIARNAEDTREVVLRLARAPRVRNSVSRQLAARRHTWLLHDVAAWSRRFSIAMLSLLDLHLADSLGKKEGRKKRDVRGMHVVLADERYGRASKKQDV